MLEECVVETRYFISLNIINLWQVLFVQITVIFL